MTAAEWVGTRTATPRRLADVGFRRAAVAVAAAFALGAAPAALANSVRAVMIVDGATLVDDTTRSAGSLTTQQARSSNTYNLQTEGRAFADGSVGGRASAVGTANAKSQVTAQASGYYDLRQPAGAAVSGGKLVLQVMLSGEITGTATMDLSADVTLYADAGITQGTASRKLSDEPGSEEIEFGVEVPLPGTVDPGEIMEVLPVLTLNAIATTTAGGNLQTSTADALDTGKISGFRVLNAAGVQVTGFTLAGGGKAIPELVPPPAGKALAIEYFNPEFAHYFIETNPDVIAKLDAGVIKGWQRTGQSFNVFATPGPGRAAVCRFFSASFAPKSSHFYAPRGLGCEAVLANPVWTFEGDVFYTALPDANGVCPAGNVPVYRLYNNGMGGAPNHRFTTSESIQLDMIRDGYVAEGTGTGVGMCSPQ